VPFTVEQRRRWRQLEYRERRRALIREMGGKNPACHYCRLTGVALEFEHPKGRDYDPAKMDRLTRLRQYRSDWRAGNLVLACRSCNATRNGRETGCEVCGTERELVHCETCELLACLECLSHHEGECKRRHRHGE
jgi:5-methylcytosine-specific restriction endonuclease McrA